MSSNDCDYQQFKAIFVGKCIVKDPMAKTSVKMATRSIVKHMFNNNSQSRRRSLPKFGTNSMDSLEVIINVYSDRVLVRNRSLIMMMEDSERIDDQLFEWNSKTISSCFVLREDKRIISVVAFNPENLQMEAYVFYMADRFIVAQLMNILYKMLVENFTTINGGHDGNEDSNSSTDSLCDNHQKSIKLLMTMVDGRQKNIPNNHHSSSDDIQLINL